MAFNVLKLKDFIFGNKEHISKAMDIISKTGDALIETSEEQRTWALAYLESTKGQNVTRRFGAVMIFCIWGFLVALLVLARIVEILTGAAGAELFYDDISTLMVDHVNTPFSIVMGFYYLTHSLKAFKGGK